MECSYRCCDFFIVIDIHFSEDVIEVRVGDEVVLSNALDTPARSPEVADDVLSTELRLALGLVTSYQELVQLHMVDLPGLHQQPVQPPVDLK